MPNQTLYDNFSQVRQYIDQEKPDLSSYVTKSELSGCSYVTKDELSAQSYLTTVPNTYPTYVAIESMGYMTQAASYAYLSVENLRTNNNRPVQLRATGLQFISSNYTIAPREISYEYINTSTYSNAWIGNTTLKNYVNGRLAEIEASYVTSSDLPVINENIIPKETGTYTLGDVDHLYNAAYTSRVKVGNNSQIYNDGGGITFSVNSNNGIRIGGSTFYPKTSGGYSNGSSTNLWSATYTNDLYYSGKISYISDKTKLIMNDRNIDIYANNKKLVNISDYGGFVPMQTSFNLGSSANYWGTTYTTNLYADNIHNFIWTGTSAEYAALSDYTTYQFYLIENE